MKSLTKDIGGKFYILLFLSLSMNLPTQSSADHLKFSDYNQILTITTKSFIRPINLDTETADIAELFSSIVINIDVGENPTTDSEHAEDFRLYSELRINADCINGKIAKWHVSDPNTALGKEAFGTLPATQRPVELQVFPSQFSPTHASIIPIDKLTFSYSLLGRPNDAAAEAMHKVKSRKCVWIWHKIEGHATCKSNQLKVNNLSLQGSQFPSHKTWLDGVLVHAIDQGAIASLWECDNGAVK